MDEFFYTPKSTFSYLDLTRLICIRPNLALSFRKGIPRSESPCLTLFSSEHTHNQEAEDQPQPVTIDDENGTGEDGKDMSLRELKRNIFEVLPDSILPPPDHKVKSKTIAEQMLSQDRPQDDDDTDYSLPLSQVMTSAIEEVKHQKQAFTSKYPRIRGFHVSNYQVQGDTLKSSYSRTDEDAALLALSTGRRRSEIHALTRESINISEDTIQLGVNRGFMAKTQKASDPELKILVRANPGNPNLCPYLTLLEYLTVTNDLCDNNGNLFLSYIRPHKPITQDSVSRWICCAIRDSYKVLDMSSLPETNAHEVRAIAASMFISDDNNVDDILATGLWSSKWSFLGHYKRDIPWDLSQFKSLVVVNKVLKL
ncbi:uncharacterized protein [Watersipora subatra]|uniref:uncharacterized protein n=1 Tax=Watersipora subatra TaxID=2589382 RepID=UPI00355B9DB1